MKTKPPSLKQSLADFVTALNRYTDCQTHFSNSFKIDRNIQNVAHAVLTQIRIDNPLSFSTDGKLVGIVECQSEACKGQGGCSTFDATQLEWTLDAVVKETIAVAVGNNSEKSLTTIAKRLRSAADALDKASK